MRRLKKTILLLVVLLFTSGCAEREQEKAPGETRGQVEISLTYNRRTGIASNQYAVWIEDINGQLVKTLYVTRFTAEGGWKYRPDSLPTWVSKSGIKDNDAQAVDEYSGATPLSGRLTYVWDCTDENGQEVPGGEYRFLVEGTIFWKDAVIYEGVIYINGEENSAKAEAKYTTESAGQSDMIIDVEAVYMP